MPRSMWKGVVSFGMVSIPIRLDNATEASSKVSFRQLCPEHKSPISYKRWCPEGEHEVSYGEILKGFEVGRDRYVIIDDKDLDNLPLATAHSVDIQEFVPAEDIEPGLYFKNAYFIEPEELGKKPYHLLRKALEATGRMAIAKIALRDREHLCALHANGNGLLMNTLNWPDEIRTTEGLGRSGLISLAWLTLPPTSCRWSSRASQARCGPCRPHRRRRRSAPSTTSSRSSGTACDASSSGIRMATSTFTIEASTT